MFASEVEPPAPRLSVATAQRRPARKSLRFICSYRWLAVRLGSVKAVPLLLFHLLPRSDANLLRPSEGNARERRATRGERGGDVPARLRAFPHLGAASAALPARGRPAKRAPQM